MEPNNGAQPTNPAPVNDQPTAEDQEWEAAAADFQKDHGLDPGKPKEEPKKDEQANRPEDKQTPEGGKTPEADPKDKKPNAEPGAGNDPKKEAGADKKTETPDGEEAKNQGPQDNPAIREHRNVQRQIEEDRRAVQEDVRKEMFADLPRELTDADGDPIKTIEDVQKLINPNTKKPFTEEEAAAWLLAAQQHLNKQLEQADRQVEEISEVNLALKDQSDAIRTKYGELLKANPNGIREKIWAAYEKTLVKDAKTGIIIKAPVSLEEFYETALAPYEAMAAQMEAAEATKPAEQKKEVEEKKKQERSDRSDIYGGGKTDTMDQEEKEWADAAKKLYES